MSKLRFDMFFRPAVFPEKRASGMASAMANQSAFVTNRREDFVDSVFTNGWILGTDTGKQPSTTPGESLKFFQGE
ncbi:hypothetical protein D9M71_738140 [compost metagenome]